MRLLKTNNLLNIVYTSGVTYPAPSNITYFWNFGIYVLVCLFIQLITGILLAMYYVPNIDVAFNSVEHIMRDVNYVWLIKYVHANEASMFFIVVYTHLFRDMYYGLYFYPREFLWSSGVIILILMIGTAFFWVCITLGQIGFACFIYLYYFYHL